MVLFLFKKERLDAMYKEIQIKECDLNKQQEKIKKLMEEKKSIDVRKVIKT